MHILMRYHIRWSDNWLTSKRGCSANSLDCLFFFSSRRRHTRFDCDWSSDVCSSDLRSRHSLRAYAYDVAVWLRFLDACGKTVWEATRDDVSAYHRERRLDEADHRIMAEIGRASCRERV